VSEIFWLLSSKLEAFFSNPHQLKRTRTSKAPHSLPRCGPRVCYKCLCAYSAQTAASTTTTSLSILSSRGDSLLLLGVESQSVPCLNGPTFKAVAGEAPTLEAAVVAAEAAVAVEAAVGDAASSGGGTRSGERSD
jgi:hypothetical protein